MKNITVRKANRNEMSWINTQYEEANFQESQYNKEDIVIAEIKGAKCGLGRLINIDQDNLELGGIYVLKNYQGLGVADRLVSHLMNHANPQKRIWCLPFIHLSVFYTKFGFVDYKEKTCTIPGEIVSKYKWCNANYKMEVLLLVK